MIIETVYKDIDLDLDLVQNKLFHGIFSAIIEFKICYFLQSNYYKDICDFLFIVCTHFMNYMSEYFLINVLLFSTKK